MANDSTPDPYYLTLSWKMLRNGVVSRDRKTCQYCGNHGFMADHVIPRKYGGKDHHTNLVCCCAQCNELLGNKLFSSFAEKKAWLLAHFDERPSYKKPINAQIIVGTRKPSTKCSFITTSGKQCKNKPLVGLDRCVYHDRMERYKSPRKTKKK